MHTPIECEFCGAALEPIVREFLGRKVAIGHAQCRCPGAVARREREEIERVSMARAEAERKRREAYERAGIPPKYLDAEADIAGGIKAVFSGRGLYLQGENGTGKTTYAAAISKAVVDAGKSVVFTSSSRMKGELFSTSFERTEEDLFGKWARHFLLVVDDLGKECDNKAVVPMLYRVINERDEQLRPIVVTSNFSRQQLGEQLAQCGDVSCAKAIVSRLFGMCDKMDFQGRDRRLS